MLFSVFTLAVGLAMDATAVAAARGVAAPNVRYLGFVRLALMFGLFQAVMPVIGWAVGARFHHVIEAWDHWIAFALLAGIGLKMLWDVLRNKEEEEEAPSFGWWPITVLAFATSIDALAAGLTLPMLGLPILTDSLVIGITTALLSFGGVFIGRHFGSKVGHKLDVFGGIVLIGLGTKILVEHLSHR